MAVVKNMEEDSVLARRSRAEFKWEIGFYSDSRIDFTIVCVHSDDVLIHHQSIAIIILP